MPPQLERSTEPIADRVDACVAAIRARTALVPAVGVVLGSGLGGVADRIETDPPSAPAPAPGVAVFEPAGAVFETATLPHWPRSTVPGHAGRLVLGFWGGAPVVVLRGRSHVYEGYRLDEVTLPHRVMRALGAHTLLVTNAVGVLNPRFAPGDLMLVRDHINMIGKRGLLAPAELVELGGRTRPERFYTPIVLETIREVARERGIPLREGVLLGGLGPAYETAAEIGMARRAGADAACMSSVHEITLAAALGLRTGAVSCATNYATGLAPEPLTHEEVTEVAARVAGRLEELLGGSVARLQFRGDSA